MTKRDARGGLKEKIIAAARNDAPLFYRVGKKFQ